uniref:Uncharacterized protein n=1 Tax=Ascaris lumbricoides TaxID=6252 RepID=A0A9J2Q823_ASCLU
MTDDFLFGIFPGLLVSAPIFICAAFFLRKYFKGAQFDEPVDASGKVAIVTGASSGIGKQVARGLNLRGAKVYMLCRNREKALCAIEQLVESGCDRSRLLLLCADLSSFASIRAFVDSFIKAEDRLDILVNNAGVFALPSFQKTIDGYETTFQCNYLGHFLLTEILMESLCSSGHGRIVNVSSMMHSSADSIAEDVVNNPNFYSRFHTYNRSKLANVMHVRALTTLWRESGENRVTANACHPGAVHTNILQYTFIDREPWRTLLKPIFAFFFKTDEDGAQTPLYLALSKHLDGISGEYFSNCAKASMASLAKDDKQCKYLYEYSKKAVIQHIK